MNNNIRVYEVGGAVRDGVLGVKNKDRDFAVEAPSYAAMRGYILMQGGTIYLETQEFVTIRGKLNGVDADFVLCRKDGQYSDGRRPDSVMPGTIYDDLARRDFTINAMAIPMDDISQLIDPYDGERDIYARLIRCVGNTEDRMREDYLRLLRAARFSITKEFHISDEIEEMFFNTEVVTAFTLSVSVDRIRDELYKMFSFDSVGSIDFFGRHMVFATACFANNLWLRPTSEKR